MSHPSVIKFLREEGYLNYFNREELEAINKNIV